MAGKVLWKFQFTKSSSQLCNAILWPTGTNLYILGLIDAHWILLQATLSQNPWFSLDEVTKINKKTHFQFDQLSTSAEFIMYFHFISMRMNPQDPINEFLLGNYLILIVPATSLCSRNFQNVKLRLDFVEIW